MYKETLADFSRGLGLIGFGGVASLSHGRCRWLQRSYREKLGRPAVETDRSSSQVTSSPLNPGGRCNLTAPSGIMFVIRRLSPRVMTATQGSKLAWAALSLTRAGLQKAGPGLVPPSQIRSEQLATLASGDFHDFSLFSTARASPAFSALRCREPCGVGFGALTET